MRSERAGPAVPPCRCRQSHGLHAQAQGRFHPLLQHGRICLTNNVAERALRGIAIGHKNWLFAGSDRGGERGASMHT
jgi:Transposase IS66 family